MIVVSQFQIYVFVRSISVPWLDNTFFSHKFSTHDKLSVDLLLHVTISGNCLFAVINITLIRISLNRREIEKRIFRRIIYCLVMG